MRQPIRITAIILMAATLSIVERVEAGSSPLDRALSYLEREVPRWDRENGCFSCHNNGDGARALYRARRLGIAVPDEALVETTRWLTRPEAWEHNGGEGAFSDKRLARVQFAAALVEAIEARSVSDPMALRRAADRLAEDQEPDGSWPIEGGEAPRFAGHLRSTARHGDGRSGPPGHGGFRSPQSPYYKGLQWIRKHEIRNVLDASAVLLGLAQDDSPESGPRRRLALDLLRRGQSPEGGWGPYVHAPPEPFDTALALLALDSFAAVDETTRAMMAKGRAFLIGSQLPDGSWRETTRPPGYESYAQRLSTTGWATLALLATRQNGDESPAP